MHRATIRRGFGRVSQIDLALESPEKIEMPRCMKSGAFSHPLS